ncbi:hypothetical protein CCACVL1_08618 [Corchorus capsularis]|uniref:Uncharacterized protein n=1 Tax=Corchorus capsularis TaxID=210143 RepID=A0A1R3IZI2_COCAP|nr:hypothetical protein CCACVL1_08618 [Corchorus capsularis]
MSNSFGLLGATSRTRPAAISGDQPNRKILRDNEEERTKPNLQKILLLLFLNKSMGFPVA